MKYRSNSRQGRIVDLIIKYPTNALCAHDIVSMLNMDESKTVKVERFLSRLAKEDMVKIVAPKDCERVTSPHRHVSASTNFRMMHPGNQEGNQMGDDEDIEDELQELKCECGREFDSKKGLGRHRASCKGSAQRKKRKYTKRQKEAIGSEIKELAASLSAEYSNCSLSELTKLAEEHAEAALAINKELNKRFNGAGE